jgi:hypothetical protein
VSGVLPRITLELERLQSPPSPGNAIAHKPGVLVLLDPDRPPPPCGHVWAEHRSVQIIPEAGGPNGIRYPDCNLRK